MDFDFEAYLARNYGYLFERVRPNPLPGHGHKQYIGLSCGEGWFLILRQMCSSIAYHLNMLERKGMEKLDFKIIQVKEKFGALRVYSTGGDPYIHGVIRMAEAMSEYTCEETGNPGVLHRTATGWLKTLSLAEGKRLNAELYKSVHVREQALEELKATLQMPPIAENTAEPSWDSPMEQVIGDYKLVCTCSVCPEQYDVLLVNGGAQVGYLRLRHGFFRADYPVCGGETVYTQNTVGDGCFASAEERKTELTAAIAAIDAFRKELLG